MRFFTALMLTLFSLPAFADDGFVPLFDGESLDGWEQHGGEAKYTIEDGMIVGTSVPKTPNSFLCTKREYDDFILEVDLKVDSPLNSGIQIRSQVFAEQTESTFTNDKGEAVTRKIPADRVHGYQVEIDPSDRAWSGGIYDEARRGWLRNLSREDDKPAREAFKPNEWNHYTIQCVGNKFRTWVNGVPAANLTDDMTSSGLIALQVHGVGGDESKVGKQVRWKNIRIKEIPPAPEKPENWVVYGPEDGKHIVLISGDEEYRSEEALPQLGKILAERHGFKCTVLFPINPETGFIDPNFSSNIPGLEALRTADLMVIFTRFRSLPDDKMQLIYDYLSFGGPVIGMRTATHAFNMQGDSSWKQFSNGYNGEEKEWKDGFGRLVLGEKWISHHGHHKHQSTRGLIVDGQSDNPILRGIESGEIWGPTDVYGVRLPLPGDSQPLVLGQVVNRAGEFDGSEPFFGMKPTDTEADPKKNDPMMPIAWTKSYQVANGKVGQAFTTTMGSSTDLVNEGVRRMLVNAVYVLLGMESEIPEEGTNVDIVGDYNPTAFEFRRGDYWPQRKMTVSEHR